MYPCIQHPSIVGTLLARVLYAHLSNMAFLLISLGRCLSTSFSIHALSVRVGSHLSHALSGEEADALQLSGIGQVDNHLLSAGLLNLLQAFADALGSADQPLFAQATGGDIAPEHLSLLKRLLLGFSDRAIEQHVAPDLVIVAPDILAVPLNDIEFMGQALVIQVADIASVGILCDQLQRHLLAPAADEQRDMRLLHPFRLINCATHVIIPALERRLLLAPHLQDNLHRLAKVAQAFRGIGILIAIGPVLMLIPARANAEVQSAM